MSFLFSSYLKVGAMKQNERKKDKTLTHNSCKQISHETVFESYDDDDDDCGS